jgi:xanthine dehydrogenase accessory factor
MSPNDLLEKARQLNAAGTAYALITVVRAIAPTSAYVGAQAIVLADGALLGWIGGGCAKSVVVGAALAAIASGKPRLVRISNDALLPEEDVEQFTMACASNGTIELFIQPHGARGELCVLGATPAADEARFLAQRLRIGLSNAPGDAAVVLVATQGQGDEDALDNALRSAAPHVLLIASRRKADKLREAMRQRGVNEAQLAKLQAPAGPDAGAKTPAEIALLAIAGVLGRLRGRATVASGSVDARPGAPDAVGLHIEAPDASAPRVPSAHAQGLRKPLSLPPVAAQPGQFINPVCGMAVQIASATRVETYDGQAYYFCCDGCWVTFRQNPAKYTAKPAAA